MNNLSDRLRAGVEAAPWVIEEIKKLEALSQPVSMEPSVWVDHDTGAVSFTKPLRPTYVNYFNESQLAAARQQGAEEERKKRLDWAVAWKELDVNVLHSRIAELEQKNAVLLEALKEATTSLETISRLAGKAAYLGDNGERIPTYMEHHDQVRMYANSRATVAREAMREGEGT